MCPAASLPPCSVCHFVRAHKNATRSCVEEEGKGIGCLMDIPEAKASTLVCFCSIARSSEFVFMVDLVGRLQSLGCLKNVGRRTNGV